MPRTLLLLTLALFGCKGADHDGDNFPASVDCDDEDAAIFPGAAELCDGVDNDCDGAADNSPEGGLTLYADNDGDGYGNPNYGLQSCGELEGFVANADDCDDVSATALPGGVEVCDGHDNDCNGAVDDGVDDAPIWYADEDGDGFGATGSVPVQNCAAPEGYADNDGDCDDTRPELNPETVWYVDADSDGYGALAYPIISCEQIPGTVSNWDDCDDLRDDAYPGHPEVCDLVDNDCDGQTDAADDDVQDISLWYADSDGDGYGVAGSEVADCFAPSGYSGLSDDCDDADVTTNPGAVEVCDGVDNDCDLRLDNGCPLLLSDAPALFSGASTADYFGYALNNSGDIDGDGSDDLVVGAYGDDGIDNVGNANGAAYVFYGPFTTGSVAITSAGSVVRGLGDSDYLGYTVGHSADLNGDGYADVLLGAYGEDTAGSAAGAAYVFAGPLSGELDASAATFTVYGDGADDVLGNYYVSAAGDLDGDGAVDLAVGAHAYDIATGSSSSGAIYMFFGPNTGAAMAAEADLIFYGSDGADYVGYVCDIGDDFNGDGVSDMVIGASGSSSGSGANAAYLLYGPFTAGSLDSSAADVSFEGDSSSRGTGSYISSGDLNGDGQRDLAMGAKFSSAGGNSSGSVYALMGPFSGSYTVPTDADFHTYEVSSSMYLGAQYNPVIVDDIDGDGFADLTVASYNHSGRVSGGGGAFLFWGPMSGTVEITSADREFLGTSTSEYAANGLSLGDADGDGVLDVAMGSRNYSGGAGRVGLWFGTGL